MSPRCVVLLVAYFLSCDASFNDILKGDDLEIPHSDALAETTTDYMAQLDDMVNAAVVGNVDIMEFETNSPSLSPSMMPSPVPSPTTPMRELMMGFGDIVEQLRELGSMASPEQQKAAHTLLTATDTESKAYAARAFADTLSRSQLEQLRRLSSRLATQDTEGQLRGRAPLLPRVVDEVASHARNSEAANQALQSLVELYEGQDSDDNDETTTAITNGIINGDSLATRLSQSATRLGGSDFNHWGELIAQVVVCVGVVIPSAKATHLNRPLAEITGHAWVDAIAEASHIEVDGSVEVKEQMGEAVTAIGRLVGGFEGYNPVEMVVDIISPKELEDFLELLSTAPTTFPGLSPAQADTATKVIMSLGLGLDDQQRLLGMFESALSKEQRVLLNKLRNTALETLVASVETRDHVEDGSESALAREVARQQEKMNSRRRSASPANEIATTFSNLLPLVDRTVICAASAIPSIHAVSLNKNKSEMSDKEITDALLLATGLGNETENVLDDFLGGLAMLGHLEEEHAHFNPMAAALTLLSQEQTEELHDNITEYVRKSNPLSTEGLAAGQELVDSLSLSLNASATAVDKFVASLGESESKLLWSLRQRVGKAVTGRMIGEDGLPTPALGEVINAEMERLKLAASIATTRLADSPSPQQDLQPNDGIDQIGEPRKVKPEEEGIELGLVFLGEAPGDKRFGSGLSVLGQIGVHAAGVVPGLALQEFAGAPTQSEPSALSDSQLINAIASAAAGTKIEPGGETPKTLLTALVELGNTMGERCGVVNPVKVLVDVIGDEAKAEDVLYAVVKTGKQLPALDQNQIPLAQQVLMSVGSSVEGQQAAIDGFQRELSLAQRQQLQELQNHLIASLMNASMNSIGQPTAGLVSALIKANETIPIEKPRPKLNVGEETQALLGLSIGHTEQGRFERFMPLIGQTVAFVSVAGFTATQHASSDDLRVASAMAEAAHVPTALSQHLSVPEIVQESLISAGSALGAVDGYNPAMMMSNVLEKDGMKSMTSSLTESALSFPTLTDRQLTLAQNFLNSAGLGFKPQQQALDDLTNIFSEQQMTAFTSLQQHVASTLVSSMMTQDGQPSPTLISEVKSQLKRVDENNFVGNGVDVPENIQLMANEAKRDVVKSGLGEEAALQALLLVQHEENLLSDVKKSPKFISTLPLMSQGLVVVGAVVPAALSARQSKPISELDTASLLQAVSEVGRNSTKNETKGAISTLFKVDAMIALGDVLGGMSGYNPIALVANVVGRDEMESIVGELVEFSHQFPALTKDQLFAAEKVLVTAGSGLETQQRTIDDFIDTLSPDQQDKLDEMQAKLMNRVVSKMITPNGEPTDALVNEITRQLREIEKGHGSRDTMPIELQQLANRTSNSTFLNVTSENLEEAAHLQSLLVLRDGTTGNFANLFDLVNQVVSAGVVIPSLKRQTPDKNVEEKAVVLAWAEAAHRPNVGEEGRVSALRALGASLAQSEGYNPVHMMNNLVGDEEIDKVSTILVDAALSFGPLDENQIELGDQFVKSAGVTFEAQQRALKNFISSLTQDQSTELEKIQTEVLKRLTATMVTNQGQPSPKLVAEVKSQLDRMEQQLTNTDTPAVELWRENMKRDPVKVADEEEDRGGVHATQALLQTVAGVGFEDEDSEDWANSAAHPPAATQDFLLERN